VKTYYDGKSSAQISKELNISDSTIRWHLVETRKKLKRRIEMDNHENLNYKPIALNAGWSGENCKTMRGIGQYRLVDNILYVCYGEPLTIEEISQKLSVAAAFVEPHIEELVYMDDMKQIGSDKYQTNIFIRTKAFLEIEQRYTYDNIGAKAEKIYEAIEKRFDKIKDINFVGSDLDKDFLLWILICYQTERLERKAKNIISKTKEFLCCTPKRKDGSEHYVRAFLQEDDYVSPMPEEVQAFGQKCDYCISNAWAPHEISSYQIVSYATIQAGDRNILWGNALKQIQHIVKISKNDLAPDKYTETLIAEYAKSGLMKVDGGKIKILMPYLTKNEYEKLDEILLEAEAKLGEDFFVDYIEGYMKKAKTQIPDFLPDNEKNYVVTGISCVAPVPYYLSERGKLRYPTDEEAKRLGIIVWELT
ncbi:MAG: LuxR C-terminal-related transcriptional regulator, partial [Oscillospiraceae bacterium]|nr:LuxR C-terminal-related transcriptional regulator [Oscillospiraceae bacterium]